MIEQLVHSHRPIERDPSPLAFAVGGVVLFWSLRRGSRRGCGDLSANVTVRTMTGRAQSLAGWLPGGGAEPWERPRFFLLRLAPDRAFQAWLAFLLRDNAVLGAGIPGEGELGGGEEPAFRLPRPPGTQAPRLSSGDPAALRRPRPGALTLFGEAALPCRDSPREEMEPLGSSPPEGL